jgi:hypothetical protein
MRNIVTFVFALASFCAFAQSGSITKTAGVNYSAGAPTWTPNANTASELAFDTTGKRFYFWNRKSRTWDLQGRFIDEVAGSSAPAYTPSQTDSWVAVNNANPPEIYVWSGSAWVKVSGGGGGGTTYTAGTGIAISGSNLISNTAPDQTVSISGGGINTVTGTYPSFTVTGNEVDGSTTNELQTIDTFSIVGQTLSISLSSDNVSVRQVTLPASGITALTGDVTATGPGSAAATIAAGSVDSVKVAALSISDVHIQTVAPSKILQAGATAGQVLAWNGTSNIWAPATVSGGSGWALTGNAATAGSSFLGTTNLVSLRFRTNNVQRMIIDSVGRVGIGVAPTTTKFHVLGNANASGTYTAEFHNSTGTNNALRIRDDGRVIASVGYFTGDATSLAGLLPNSGNSNKGIILRGNLLQSDTGDDIIMENGQGNAANTSGIRNLFFTSRGFAPTSGTGEFRAFALAPVVNQTGAANGPSIGFLAVPTLTSAVSWRSFEYRNNSGFGIYGSGTASNYINGNIGVRTTAPTDNIDINGSNGYTQLRLRTTYTPTSSADALGADGEIAIDANYIYVKVGGSWKRAALTTF